MQKTAIMQHQNKSLQELTRKMNAINPTAKGEPLSVEESAKQNEKYTGTMLEKNKILTLLIIPLVGFLTWFMFKKSGFNYAENLVMNVLLSGQLSILFLVFCLIPFLLLPSFVILWTTLFSFLNWIYAIIVYKQFFKQRWTATILKGIVLQLMITAVVFCLTTGLSALAE